MNIAYLILAHKNCEQVYKLINVLDSENSFFFIHLKKSFTLDIIEPYKSKNNVHFSPIRFNSGWCGYKVVLATLELMKAAYNSDHNIDYYVVLSGQCYPIKALTTIDHFFSTNRNKCFVECISMPDKKQVNGGMHKLEYSWFMDETSNWNPYFRKYFHKSIHFLQKISFQKRKYFIAMKPYFGSQWWALPKDAVEYCIKITESNPKFLLFHKRVFCADELYFQTLIGNSKFFDKLVNKPFRYIDWKTNGPPKTLTKEDFTSLATSEHLFARKFDLLKSHDLIETINSLIINTPVKI